MHAFQLDGILSSSCFGEKKKKFCPHSVCKLHVSKTRVLTLYESKYEWIDR